MSSQANSRLFKLHEVEVFSRNPTEFRNKFVERTLPVDHPSADVVFNEYVTQSIITGLCEVEVINFSDRKTNAAKDMISQLWKKGIKHMLRDDANEADALILKLKQYLAQEYPGYTVAPSKTLHSLGCSFSSYPHLLTTDGTPIYLMLCSGVENFNTSFWQARHDHKAGYNELIYFYEKPAIFIAYDRQLTSRIAKYALNQTDVKLAMASLNQFIIHLSNQLENGFSLNPPNTIPLDRPHWLAVHNHLVQNTTFYWSK